MGNAKSLSSDVQKNKRLASNVHAELLEAVYEHSDVLIDFIRGEMRLPRPTLDPSAARSQLDHEYQRRIARLKVICENEKLEDMVKELKDKIHELSSAPISALFNEQWTALHAEHQALGSRGASQTVTLQPQFEMPVGGRVKKGPILFVDALIEETYCKEFYIANSDPAPEAGFFSRTTEFRSLRDAKLGPVEAHRRKVLREISEPLPTVQWVTNAFNAWVELRPDEVGIGSLIADLQAVMDLDLTACSSRQRDCMLCIGSTRTPVQVEMLRSVGVLYLGRDRLFELIRSASPA